MIQKLHRRCWVAGTPALASHHPSETAANNVVIEHLLQASLQIAMGELEPTAMPVEDIWRVSRPVLDTALQRMPAAARSRWRSSALVKPGRSPPNGR